MLLKKTKKKSLSCRNKGFKIWSSLSVILSLHLESPLSSPSPFIQAMYFIPLFISMMKIFMKEAKAKKKYCFGNYLEPLSTQNTVVIMLCYEFSSPIVLKHRNPDNSVYRQKMVLFISTSFSYWINEVIFSDPMYQEFITQGYAHQSSPYCAKVKNAWS